MTVTFVSYAIRIVERSKLGYFEQVDSIVLETSPRWYVSHTKMKKKPIIRKIKIIKEWDTISQYTRFLVDIEFFVERKAKFEYQYLFGITPCDHDTTWEHNRITELRWYPWNWKYVNVFADLLYCTRFTNWKVNETQTHVM